VLSGTVKCALEARTTGRSLGTFQQKSYYLEFGEHKTTQTFVIIYTILTLTGLLLRASNEAHKNKSFALKVAKFFLKLFNL
jgi:hypothetical protein